MQKQSVKRNKIGNRECLSLPKETLQVSDKLTSGQKSVDCSQATVQSSQLIEDTSQATVETLCNETFIQSNFEGALNFKVALENLKLQIIAEIKDLFFNEISSFKECFSKSSANRSSDTELHQQQILFPKSFPLVNLRLMGLMHHSGLIAILMLEVLCFLYGKIYQLN